MPLKFLITRRFEEDCPLDDELVKFRDVFRMIRAAATGPLGAGTLFIVDSYSMWTLFQQKNKSKIINQTQQYQIVLVYYI